LQIIPDGAAVRVVSVRDSQGRSRAANLRKIELISPGIRARDEKPAHRVTQSGPRCALAPAEVARVLAQERRENAFCRQVFYCEITVSRAKPLGVARDPLPEGRIRIGSLSES
jgi:hypothetical protein